VIVLPGFWQKGKWVLALILAIILLLIAKNTGMERSNLTTVEVWLRDLLAPLESGATVVTRSAGSMGSFLTDYRGTIRERDKLKDEVARLKNEINLLTEAKLENVRLHQLLEMKETIKNNWTTVSAKVIGRDRGNWHHSIIINKGTNDGFEKDMVVINQDGLVGRIIAVSHNSSEVLLIADKESSVGCLVQLSRTPGVVEGVGAGGLLRMIHIPYDTVLKENQVVISSGLGGTYPQGLRVGYILEVKVEPNGLMKQALIKPFVNFDRLEEVLVLKMKKEVMVP
jgi:rod shape-determining protein MreC